MAFLDKLNAVKDKAIGKGKTHWDENKDDYKEKAAVYKEKAVIMKEDIENRWKERKGK
ncbi:hypothetical protein KQ939_09455 [Planococcus sp. CP5-4]|uniref:hypothetical protein n=1 Tax=unclassified Planococcus (in: firmicutes) TaxID=2662419 RepID=UPI001C21AB55|nr:MULTISPECIES: hypothetical protein [unclassified Planococcus (in: firmicutes)]MBU9673765.1 hypothetical protein [Planococcus sp. CP5-4_YE]MBV0908889.1 hypothetical protein [Planococcus sp. CP5-4_UN]MBW6063938.1 hypothetical protein [Planococcus sp. CP5-4]